MSFSLFFSLSFFLSRFGVRSLLQFFQFVSFFLYALFRVDEAAKAA